MSDVTDLKVHFLSFIDFENLSSVWGSFFLDSSEGVPDF